MRIPQTTFFRAGRYAAVALLIAFLAACGSSRGPSGTGPGGYPIGGGNYRADGPHANPPPNLHRVPDAQPRIEPLASGPNRPYTIAGKRYVPDTSWRPYRVRGRASWYGRQFHGRPTSSGEPYDMYAMTAAHPTLPIPSYARVTNTSNGRSVVVRINDRGPFVASRVIDLSYVAAYRLGTLSSGTGDVLVELITPDQIRSGHNTMLASATNHPAPATRTLQAPRELPAPPSRMRSHLDAAPPATINTVATETPRATTATALPATPASYAAPDQRAVAVAPATQGYFLQVGAFGEAENARALARKLSAQMARSHPTAVQQHDDRLYRVRLGPFHDRQQAMTEVEAIYQQTGIMPHVVSD